MEALTREVSSPAERSVREDHDVSPSKTRQVGVHLPEINSSNDASDYREAGSPSATMEVDDEYPAGVQLGFIVIALLLSIFLAALDMTIVATAIPEITTTFHSLDDVGWYGSAFFLTLAAFQSFWGKLYRFCSLKPTFLSAGLVFEVGSLVCGRAIAGMGAAGLYCGCYTIIAFVTRPEHRPRYTGLVGVAYAVASVAGPLLGGVFTDRISWRWCFYINLPIGGLSLAIIMWSFTPPASAKPISASWKEILLGLDLPGLLIALIALVCYLLAMQWAGISKPWNSGTIITLLVLSSFLGVCFFVVQFLQKENAALVPRILSNRVIIGVSLFAFFQNGVNFFFCYYLPIYFQAIDGFSAAQSGVYNLPLIFGACFFAVVSGLVITIWDRYTFYMAAGSMLCTIAAGLLFTLDERSRLARPIGYQLLLGAGQGWAIQVPVIVGQAFSEPEDISATTAVILFFQMTGGAICISAGQSLFTNRLLHTLRYLAPQMDAREILQIGASDLRQKVAASQLPGVLQAYMIGIKDTFALGIALAGCAFLCTWIAPISRLATLSHRSPVPSPMVKAEA